MRVARWPGDPQPTDPAHRRGTPRSGCAPAPTDGLDRARELADRLRIDPPSDAARRARGLGRAVAGAEQCRGRGSLLSNVHPLEAVRDIAERAEQDAMRLLHRAQPGPGDLRRLRRTRPRRPRRPGRPAARQGARDLHPLRCRPRRRDPGPGGGDQRAGDRDRPGVRQEHPRRRPHHPGHPRPAGRDARRLARGPPRRRRGTGHRDHRLPRRDPGPDVRPRPRGPARPHCAVPDPRLAAERAPAHRALRPPPRAGDPGRLRRLGVVRRRREDDREGSGDPGVHRPDRRGRRGADAPRPRGAPGALPPRRARRHRDRLRRRSLLPGAGAQGAVRRRLPGGAHLLRVRPGAAGPARRDRPAVRAALRAR